MGLDSRVMGQGLHPPQTGGQVPWCPQSGPAVGQAQLPPEAPPALDAVGTFCTCLFATPSHNTVFGRFLLFIQTGYLLQIGKCLV